MTIAPSGNLRQSLVMLFDSDRLSIMCRDAGVNPVLIPYRERGLETFADQLLIYFTQRDILLAFVDVVQSQFPELDWHALANNYVLVVQPAC